MVTLQTFVQATIQQMDAFQKENKDHLKKLLTLGINQFQFKSSVKKETIPSGNYEVLYLASMAEENLLVKILELATEKEVDIEEIFEGNIVRRH